MEKRTVLAIVLSTVVFLGFNALNSYLYPTDDTVINTVIESEENNITNESEPIIKNEDSNVIEELEDSTTYIEKSINYSTELFDVTFNTKGGNITSLKLLDHTIDVNDETIVDMVLQEIDNNALFNMTVGDKLFNEIFEYKKLDNNTHQFSRKFRLKDSSGSNSSPLTLVKTYKFLPNDYMFELKISLKNNDNSLIPMNSNGSVYSLNVTKQIGPEFVKLDRREDYRKLSIYTDGKRDELKVKKQEITYNESYDWTAIEAKFFTLAIIPDNNNPSIYYTNKLFDGKETGELILSRSNLNSSFIEDTYKIYAGPKDHEKLKTYANSENNGWNMAVVGLDRIIHFTMRPLAMFFMMILEFINSVVNNYGISIILLTILLKIVLFPFTKKSFDSMGKMQTIQPELKKLQAKYKDDAAKLNAATAELYKKEGVNPLGGCLPMLLQMPIFITFYSLFNEYIGLKGATFIPGWIIDLSKPEFVLQFGFQLPLVGWDALRLLPIIYVATQLISMKFTQNQQAGGGAGASAMQTKMLTLGMPIMFFFIMYNQSSGLLLYWITQNLISSAQQIKSKKKSDKQHDLVLEEKAQKKKKKKGKK
ncbi:MAG: membrane protein insertase YidC [Spirochaetaceae bacterium]